MRGMGMRLERVERHAIDERRAITEEERREAEERQRRSKELRDQMMNLLFADDFE